MRGAPPALFDGAAGIYVDPANFTASWLRTAPPGATANVVRSTLADNPAAVLIDSRAAQAETRTRAVVTSASAADRILVLLADADQPAPVLPGTRSGSAAWRTDSATPGGWWSFAPGSVALPPPRWLPEHNCSRTPSTLLPGPRTRQSWSTSPTRPSGPPLQDLAAAADGVALNVGRYAPDNVATANAQAIRNAMTAKTGRTDYLTVIDSSRPESRTASAAPHQRARPSSSCLN
uniref:Putative cellulase n=1 Tax=Amycolatopsis sp. SANK 60206 TaxID=1642649 RepID=A0A0E3Z7J6_9PSEU|nr:putative cellulase [Amycolatopsis sp. SANK 60206]